MHETAAKMMLLENLVSLVNVILSRKLTLSWLMSQINVWLLSVTLYLTIIVRMKGKKVSIKLDKLCNLNFSFVDSTFATVSRESISIYSVLKGKLNSSGTIVLAHRLCQTVVNHFCGWNYIIAVRLVTNKLFHFSLGSGCHTNSHK